MTTDDALNSPSESSRDDRCKAPCSTETAPVYPLLWKLPRPNVSSPRAPDTVPSGAARIATQIPHRSIMHRECRPLISGCIGSAVQVQQVKYIKAVTYDPLVVYDCATIDTFQTLK